MSEKNKKKITISLIVVIAVALIWFLIISPLIQFKKSEKEVLNAGKRYFEEGKTETAAEHAPDYLRPSQAERERNQKNDERK